jgi:uncharacterized membrane protein
MESRADNSRDVGDRGPYWFNAVLHPHRSLGPRGFLVLMAVMSAMALSFGLRFLLLGAWPVMGFMGLDVLAVYIAFKVNYRRARLFETVQLTDDRLTVRRVLPDGKANEWHFMPSWVRVRMDDPPRLDSPLTLSSHGRALEIGAFLTPEERLEVAHALKDAIRRQQAGLVGSGSAGMV